MKPPRAPLATGMRGLCVQRFAMFSNCSPVGTPFAIYATFVPVILQSGLSVSLSLNTHLWVVILVITPRFARFVMKFLNALGRSLEMSSIEDTRQRIQEQLPIWSNTDKALQWVGENYRGFSLDACLLKTAAVNALYATNVQAVSRMAVGISKLFQKEKYAFHVKQNFGLLTKERAIALVDDFASTLNSQSKAEEQPAMQPKKLRSLAFSGASQRNSVTFS